MKHLRPEEFRLHRVDKVLIPPTCLFILLSTNVLFCFF